MRKFVCKCLMFAFGSAVLFYVRPVYLLYSGAYRNIVEGREIYHSIDKSSIRNSSKKVILGDSVAKQLFDNYKYNHEVNSFATVEGISMAGQYVLLKKYLDAGNVPEDVFLMLTPYTLRNDLEGKYAFQFFLKPFYHEDNFKYFSPLVHQKVSEIPYSFLRYDPYVRTSNWVPDIREPRKRSQSRINFSDLSVEYLEKIVALSRLHKFNFHFVSVPVREDFRPRVAWFLAESSKRGGFRAGMSPETAALVDKYFLEMRFESNDSFIDMVHLKNPAFFADRYLAEFILPEKTGR
jgi:hypothetical protein